MVMMVVIITITVARQRISSRDLKGEVLITMTII